jgi:hypothetical protein
MKPRYSIIASVIGLLLVVLPSCNPEDPSAVREGQKLMAETLAKNAKLEEEIVSLKAELENGGTKQKAESDQDVLKLKADLEEAKARLEDARASLTKSESVKMPSAAEIEKKLDLEGSKLKEEARQQYKGATVVGFSTADLIIPSFERPFSCKAKVTLREPSGTQRTLYWTGTASMKGEWTFTKSDSWESKAASADPVNTAANTTPSPEPPQVKPTPPVRPDPPPVRPEPPQIKEKPKPKYDIQLDNPVMGPGAR